MTNNLLREKKNYKLNGWAESVGDFPKFDQNGAYMGSDVNFVLREWTSRGQEKPALPERLPVHLYAEKRPPKFEGEQVQIAGSMGEDQYFEAESIYIPTMKYKITPKLTNWFAIAGVSLLIIAVAWWLSRNF
ncbi:MAG: hypothetical protein RW306_12895 [Geobacteraceae bacterium]|nr:hypothetical protein [Geobacteraceae bacterium]